MKVLVIGASGFVGSAVCEALTARGIEVVRERAPRLDPVALAPDSPVAMTDLGDKLKGCSALVNAAGVPDATGDDIHHLIAANAALPGILSATCAERNVRFVHVSSAAVQGRLPVLDASDRRAPFSAYSESKALGEVAALKHPQTVIYRPPGVHGADRRVTRAIARVARSPFSTVAGDGSNFTAQALIGNVGDAIAFLATCEQTPPAIVSHPSEGLTTSELLEHLGGRKPKRIPTALAQTVVSVAICASRIVPSVAGHARRVEIMWFGQEQAPSWLTSAGWEPAEPQSSWPALGRRLSIELSRKDRS